MKNSKPADASAFPTLKRRVGALPLIASLWCGAALAHTPPAVDATPAPRVQDADDKARLEVERAAAIAWQAGDFAKLEAL